MNRPDRRKVLERGSPGRSVLKVECRVRQPDSARPSVTME